MLEKCQVDLYSTPLIFGGPFQALFKMVHKGRIRNNDQRIVLSKWIMTIYISALGR